jgi:hypothetical protein
MRRKYKHVRTFRLNRTADATGVSGTGIVADGVVFPDGVVVLRWRGQMKSTVVHESIDNVEAIHGHGGFTKVIWEDQ